MNDIIQLNRLIIHATSDNSSQLQIKNTVSHN